MLFVFFALFMAICLGQSEANFLCKIKERTEGTLLYIKNATLQVIEVGQKAADVAATARGSQKG